VGAVIAGLVVLAGIGALVVVLLTRGDDDGQAEGAGGSTSVQEESETSTTGAVQNAGGAPPPTEGAQTTTEVTEEAQQATTTTESSAPPVCPSDSEKLCIEMTNIDIDGDSLVIDWTPFNFRPAIDGNHAHFYWNTTASTEAGSNAADFGAEPGLWELTDQRPFHSADVMLLSNKPPGATDVCVTPATAQHGVVDPFVFHCVPLPD